MAVEKVCPPPVADIGPAERVVPRRATARRAEVEETDVAAWVEARLGLKLDPVQRDLLSTGGRRVIVNCTRQWGKSTVTAAKAVHMAYTRPGSLTLVASKSARQSGEFVFKAEEFVRRLGMRPRGDGENETSLLFPNGARIVGLPQSEATVRGFSASLMLVDEASRVTDEHYAAVRPMLAVTNGDLWLMSTPWAKRGFFYQVWSRGGPEWKKVSVPATECPRIPASFLEEEREWLDEREFRREYLCEFSDSECALFDRETLLGAVRKGERPLWS